MDFSSSSLFLIYILFKSFFLLLKYRVGRIWLMCSHNTGEKSGIRETKNLSTDADSRTDTILEKEGRGEGRGHLQHIPIFRALLETTDPHQKVDSVHEKMRTRSTPTVPCEARARGFFRRADSSF